MNETIQKHVIASWESKPERTAEEQAVRAACMAADIHLECSYPACSCTQIPRAAMVAYEKGAEEAVEACKEAIRSAHPEDYNLIRRGGDRLSWGYIAKLVEAFIDAACLPEEEIEVTEAMCEVAGLVFKRETLSTDQIGNIVWIEIFREMERQRRKDSPDDA